MKVKPDINNPIYRDEYDKFQEGWYKKDLRDFEKEPIKEIENIINLIRLKRKEKDSSMSIYVKYPNTINHLQSIGYDISEIERDCLTKIMIGW